MAWQTVFSFPELNVQNEMGGKGMWTVEIKVV